MYGSKGKVSSEKNCWIEQNENTTYQNVCDTANMVLIRKFITNIYIRKKREVSNQQSKRLHAETRKWRAKYTQSKEGNNKDKSWNKWNWKQKKKERKKRE